MRYVRLVAETTASDGTCVQHSSALLYERYGTPDSTSKAATNPVITAHLGHGEGLPTFWCQSTESVGKQYT